MGEQSRFFDPGSLARRLMSGELKPRAALRAASKTAGLFAYLVRTTARLRAAVEADQGRDPLVGPRFMTEFGIGLLERMNFGAEVSGVFPPTRGVRQSDGAPRGQLVLCNHRTHLDVPAVGRHLNLFMVGSALVKDWPVLGKAGELAGVIYVDRSSPASRKETQATVIGRLEAGYDVLNFPEGANFNGPGMAPFKSGLFHLVVGREIDIVPMVLRYPPDSGIDWAPADPDGASHGDLSSLKGRPSFVEHFIDLMNGPPLMVQSRFGERIDCAAYTDPVALMAAVRASMLADLAHLQS